MKNIFYLFSTLLGVALFYNSNAQADTWIQKSDVGYNETNVAEPFLHSCSVGFSINGKGYIGTGESTGGNYAKDFWEYDPSTNTWTQKADFGGTGRRGAVGFSIGTKGFLGTGYDASYPNYTSSDFWEYDPSVNTWTQKAYFPGTPREFAIGFSIGPKGYIGTGYDGQYTYLKDFWEYDTATDNWTQKTDFIGNRSGAVGFNIGNKGYVGTGFNNGTYYKDFWEYDPATNNWKQKADFIGTERYFATGFRIDVKGYIGMGDDGSEYTKDFYEYNPSTDTWIKKLDYNGTPRYWAAGFSIGIKGYLGMGYDSSGYSKDFYEFNPATNRWTQKADFGGSSRSGAVAFGIGSKGYLGTGYQGRDTKDFWEYDPASNIWTQKADFGGHPRSGAVGFSINGKGYIGTGYSQNAFYLSYYRDFWEYDPAVNKWTQKADFSGLPRTGAVGFGIGNKGYLGTGGDIFYAQNNDFWEYDPGTNIWTQKADFGGNIRMNAVGFSIEGKGYIGTGGPGSQIYYKDFWEYNPVTDSWKQKRNFGGTARNYSVGFSIGSKGYLGTGSDFNYYKDFWEYDPSSNTWTKKQDFEGTERNAAVGFSIGGKGYLGTGYLDVYSNTFKNDFWEYTPSNVLPLQLITFNAKTKGLVNELSWVTAQEINSSHFDIERSNNSVNFTKIGTIKASGTKQQNNYSFTDNHPLKNTNYYRLKITDKGGTFTYSKIETIAGISGFDISISPNPITIGTANLIITRGNTSSLTITISNLEGKILHKEQFLSMSENFNTTLDIVEFPKGVYVLKAMSGNETRVIKFIKQ